MSNGVSVSKEARGFSVQGVGRTGGGMRTRTSIVLLTALLLMIVAISGLTIKLLNGQRTLLEDTIRESQAQTMALLGNRVEQALFAALRPPFLALKNLPSSKVDMERFTRLKGAFPEVEQVLFLKADMSLENSFPPAKNKSERSFNEFLAQRTVLEGINVKEER